MSDDPIDAGFDAVIGGEKWEAPVAAEPDFTATVIPTPATAGLSPEGIQAAKALVALPTLGWPDLAKLAREIAMDIREKTVILQEFKLSVPQYEFLEGYNPFYREALASACREWQAPLTTQERITVEAAAILEDSLLTIGARMRNAGEGLPGVVEAAKLFAKIAKVDVADSRNAAPGERFAINIDLGGDKKITIEAAPAPQADADGLVLSALPAIPQKP